MKPYINLLYFPHLNIHAIVDVRPRDEKTHQVKVLDFHDDENLLADASEYVMEYGVDSWVETFGKDFGPIKYTVHEKIIAANVLRHRYVNYRAVDPAHIDKLMGLTFTTMNHSVEKLDGVNKCDLIDGIVALPGNFIIARAHNKVVDRAGFNKEKGVAMVTAQLGAKARDTLYELEGYRLYRNINTLDDVLDNARYGMDMSMVGPCIANSVEYISLPKGVLYIVMPVEYNTAQSLSDDSAARKLPEGIHFVPTGPHATAMAIINSYIEKR